MIAAVNRWSDPIVFHRAVTPFPRDLPPGEGGRGRGKKRWDGHGLAVHTATEHAGDPK